jgi:uncharacterized protein YecE (DUF72 family)
MKHRFYCGTSGWNYRHWVDIFYPRALPQSKWLQRYAQDFDTVEINNSFYRLPSQETFEDWESQAPEGFTFAVKASRYLTHMRKLKDPEEPLGRILGNAEGLGQKLGPLLYQLPPGWRVNLERLEGFLSILPENLRHVMEFRGETWHTESVFDLLQKYNVAYCTMSAPGLPCHILRTADFSYIRMHNGGWDTEGNYTDESLGWWAERCGELLDQGDLYIYFNNDYKGFALWNALKLKELVAP